MKRFASQVRKRELESDSVEEFSEISEFSVEVDEDQELKGFNEAVRSSEAAASSNSFRCL